MGRDQAHRERLRACFDVAARARGSILDEAQGAPELLVDCELLCFDEFHALLSLLREIGP